MRTLLFPLIVASLLLGACKHDIQNTEAIQQAIQNHLNKRTDMPHMDVKVTSVAFRQDEADANVHLQTSSGAGLDTHYILERKGNEWVVKGMASGHGGTGTGNPHGMGGTGGMPPGHPQVPPPGGHTTAPPPEPHE